MLVLLAACQDPEPVVVEGVVWSAPGDDAPPLPAASVTFVDDEGAVLDAVVAGVDGVFRARVPAGIEMNAEIRAEGYATTTFVGVSGLQDTFRVEDHALYGVSLAERDAIAARFAGCPGADVGGAPLVVGEIRLYGWEDELGESPIVTTGIAAVGPTDACYLGNDGQAYEPRADRTGDAGAFAVFDAARGAGALGIAYEAATEVWSVEEYRVWIPDEPDVVSPWYPAWVELVY